MRPRGSSAELERRRRLAVARLEQGETPATVADTLGVSRTTLFRWRAHATQPQGLTAKPHGGPRRRLSESHLCELKALLAATPGYGGSGAAWTVRRIAGLIFRRFGVVYHPEHVRKLLRQLLGEPEELPEADTVPRAG